MQWCQRAIGCGGLKKVFAIMLLLQILFQKRLGGNATERLLQELRGRLEKFLKNAWQSPYRFILSTQSKPRHSG
jgi:hypothetical protein